ncbi:MULTISPECIES: DUF551 domain-containing protein [Burkholderia]|nr:MULTISPECIES: DUF551 domain-containing protein [Burkholderia]MDP9544183.1 hypothetical protein [Burkholderia cepacia]MBR8394144.1 DUF551 domain-containing protein [Burkholderia cenocepacia]MBR8471903.1 DUF551 domain-containing protein [Burkholderia cenocepacia]MBR8487725.1 DUF551 domain-containing protein [Burkholderia cenocepacia]MDO5917460.1 DUF551 domain-containing protein [Burkholderia cenocepacia]
MDEHSLTAARDAATAYAREHARELATELLEWSDTTLLRDGRVRELARMLQVLDAAHALKLARSFAERAALELAAGRTVADKEAWVCVDEKLPTCNRKAGSLGVEVLIWPAMETGERTAFFGRRISQKPMFYRYGAPVHGVTHWMPLPAEPPREEPSSR